MIIILRLLQSLGTMDSNHMLRRVFTHVQIPAISNLRTLC